MIQLWFHYLIANMNLTVADILKNAAIARAERVKAETDGERMGQLCRAVNRPTLWDKAPLESPIIATENAILPPAGHQ